MQDGCDGSQPPRAYYLAAVGAMKFVPAIAPGARRRAHDPRLAAARHARKRRNRDLGGAEERRLSLML